jgi:hypothetical protein
MLIISSSANATYFGPVVAAIFGGLGLASSALMAVLGAPPNKVFANSYSPTFWVAEDYAAIEKDCFEGCFTRGGIGTQDTPPICFWAKFTAKVKGSYLALQDNVTVTKEFQRFKFCGDTESDAKAAAQSAWPRGNKVQIWYDKSHPSQWTDGSTSAFLVSFSAISGILGLAGVATAISCAKHIKNAPQDYLPVDAGKELADPSR